MTSHRPPRRVFIRNLVIPSQIGVHPHEHGQTQRVRVSLWLDTPDEPRNPATLAETVDYERLANDVRASVHAILAQGHVRLVETLADRIATACLEDARVMRAWVRVEKLDVFADAESAGVEIERSREVIPQGSDTVESQSPKRET